MTLTCVIFYIKNSVFFNFYFIFFIFFFTEATASVASMQATPMVCIYRQMYRVLWVLRLYISSNVSCPLGIASVYRVNSCLGRRQQLSVYPVECLHGEGGCGGVSTRVHHLQLGLVSRHPLRAL